MNKSPTPQEAKELSLEVWRYLAEHPDMNSKYQLPTDLFLKIANMECCCPLCELFRECFACPLESCGTDSLYDDWNQSDDEAERQAAAQKIVEAIEAWEIEK